MKRFISLPLIFLFIFCSALPANATTQNTEIQPTGEIMFTAVTLGDKKMTVPVVVNNSSLQGPSSKSSSSFQSSMQEATYYIPVTEDAQEYNEQYVSKTLKSRRSRVTTDTFPDPHQYFTITSYIRYTLYPSADGKVSDFLVSMDNVAITKGADPAGMEWDILSVGTPSARINLTGYSEQSGQPTLNQEVYRNVPWGLTGIDTPSSWQPVVSGTYSNGYRGLVQYEIEIFYSTTGRQICSFTHTLAK